jgi:acyl-CoA synthetase (AMP-forming)/AMP-acid ligase II/acyl carrier protein
MNAPPPGPDDIALILHTSGTTSRPKMVPLTHANLGVSAGNVCAAIGLRQDDRCLNVMPLFHIHGLVAVLLASLVSGGSVICTPGFYATEFFGWMDSLRPTWYSAVPTMHQAILARAGQNLPVIRRTRLRLIRSSSSPLPPQVMAETERVFNVPVIEAYGMTEASHQMASNPLPPDKRKPGSVGRAAGPEVAIMDGAGRVLPTGEAGEIVIRGSNVTHGYLNNPEANGLSFVKGWFRTGDLGFLDAEGYLFITGRIKEIINRGGEKIAPREIDEVLLDHPAVARAIAFAVPDPRLGEEVAAAVVLRPGAEVTPAELRKYAEQRLAPFKVPRQVLVLESIPTGPTGKMQRIGLAEKLGLTGQKPAPHGKSEYVPPRTDVEAALVEIWCEVLRVERVGVDDPFLDLGGDSMLAMLLLTRVRARFGVDLSIADFFDAPTVAEQGGLVEASRLTSQGGTMPSRPTS